MNEPLNAALRAQDAAISTAQNSEFSSNTDIRRLNEVITSQVAEHLAGQNLPARDVLRILHRLAAHGVRLWDDQTKSEVPAGQLRTHEVRMDTVVPPQHQDVEQIFDLFSNKFDTLLSQATSVNYELLALWGYTVLMAIHPFDDVNGRVGRGFVDYSIQSVMKQRGFNIPLHQIDYSHEELRETAYSEIINAQYSLKLFPSEMKNDPSTNQVLVTTTAYDIYVASIIQGKPEVYFDAVAQLIKDHINSVNSLEDIQKLPSLTRYQELLKIAREAKKYATVNLAAEEARSAVKQHLNQ